MNSEITKQAIKQVWVSLISYLTNFFLPILKRAAEKTKEYFVNILWDMVKEDFAEQAKSTVEFIERFFDSPDYRDKERDIINTLFKNVELPLLLRPFKPFLKKVLKGKIRKLIGKYLRKFNSK